MRFFLVSLALFAATTALADPVRVIFDTDMGNDVDDAIALAELHALETRGEAKILAVTITKDNRWAPVFVDLMNTFYGRPDIPIGMVKHGATPDDGHYTKEVVSEPFYPHRVTTETELPDAVLVLRKILDAQPDGSVTIVQVGFSTNLARLLASGPDKSSPLSGLELARRKVRLLAMMAGEFRAGRGPEYNIVNDIPAAQKLFREWPGQLVTSAFDIGDGIRYHAGNIDTDFSYVAHHPLVDAYRAYLPQIHENAGSADEPLWDPTAALYAVRPDRGYFSTSAPGKISVDEKGITTFTPQPGGNERYLIVDDAQRARIREAISLLMSAPPTSVVSSPPR